MLWTISTAISSKINPLREFLADSIHAPEARWIMPAVIRGCDMDGHAAIGDDRTLRRIIAALVALAAMAAAASSRSFPVRFLVLCILRHAEAVALGFVAEAARAPRHAAEEIADVRNGPADAILLAARFAALAAALAALLRPGRHCRNVRIGGTLRLFAPMPGPGLIVPAGWTRKPHDTS